MKIRRIVSLTMLLSFAVMVYTGIMLFLCPQGRVAYWTGWRLAGLSKEQYGELHTAFMVAFIVAGVWHITLNWKPIKHYLRTRTREMRIFTPEFNVALALTAVFAVGTLAGLPPWSSLLAWEDSVKGYWERRDGSPPWGHAEENTLARFTRGLVDWERLEHQRTVRLTVEDAVAALRRAGLSVDGKDQRLVDIASANATTPQALMEILQGAEVPVAAGEGAVGPARSAGGPFPLPSSGLGRMSLARYCEKYGLELDALLVLLPDGITVDPHRKLREVADEMGTDPAGVIEMLNERAGAATPQAGKELLGGKGE